MICAPEQIGLPLVLAAVLEEVGAEPELRSLRDDAAGRAADDRAENLAGYRADLEFLPLGRLRGAVTKRDVGDLVRHDAGHFALALRGLDHPAIEEHRTARQRERVDLLLVDDVERVAEPGMPELGRNGIDQALADALDVVVHALVVQHGQLLSRLGGSLLAELDVLLQRILVRFGRDLRLGLGVARPTATSRSRSSRAYRRVDSARVMLLL